jgi:hypothetical protein
MCDVAPASGRDQRDHVKYAQYIDGATCAYPANDRRGPDRLVDLVQV